MTTLALPVEEPFEMPNVSWTQVALVLGLAVTFFASIVLLVFLKADVAAVLNAILAVILAVLAFLGYGAKKQLERQMDQVNTNTHEVKELSNGRLSDLLEQNRQLQERNTELALQVHPSDDK